MRAQVSLDGGLPPMRRPPLRRRVFSLFSGFTGREAILLAMVLALSAFVCLTALSKSTDARLPVTGQAALVNARRIDTFPHHRRLGQVDDSAKSTGDQGATLGATAQNVPLVRSTVGTGNVAGSDERAEDASVTGQDAQHAPPHAQRHVVHEENANPLNIYTGGFESSGTTDIDDDSRPDVHLGENPDYEEPGGKNHDGEGAANPGANATRTDNGSGSVTNATADSDARDSSSDVAAKSGAHGTVQGGGDRASVAVTVSADASAGNSSGSDSSAAGSRGAVVAEEQADPGSEAADDGSLDREEEVTDGNESDAADDEPEASGDSEERDDSDGDNDDDEDDDSGTETPPATSVEGSAGGAGGGNATQATTAGQRAGVLINKLLHNGHNTTEASKEDQTGGSDNDEKEGRKKSPEMTAEEKAKYEAWLQEVKVEAAAKFQRSQPFIRDLLTSGLPSARTQTGREPALKLHPIRRVFNASSLQFEFKYGTDFGVVPTLITHSQDDWFRPEQYTYERLLSLIGERPVRYPEKECAPGSDKRDSSGCHSIKEANLALIGKEWAALEPSNLTAVGVETYSDFMKVQLSEAQKGHFMYAHEISGGAIPELARELRIPKFFINNFNDVSDGANQTVDDMILETHFPSVFFGAPGSSSPLHSDAHMTRFWIMELQGRKLVRLVPPSENANADPTDGEEFQPTLYTVDLMDPDFVKHPHLDGMLVYEAILEPGDVLFIPEGWAHQALNLEWSLMISSNYVDQHNGPLFLEYSEYEHADDPRRVRDAHRLMDTFFLPMRNPRVEHGNPTLQEYFLWNNLELAPVSAAAKRFVLNLKKLGVPPDEWRDRNSRPLLYVAINWNYLALAKWLVSQGVSVTAGGLGDRLVELAEQKGFTTMLDWLREQIAIAQAHTDDDDPEDPDDSR